MKHEIHIEYEDAKGLIISGIKCPWERQLKALARAFSKDDWEILDSALSTMALHAQGMDLIDINELQSGKITRIRELIDLVQTSGGSKTK